MARPPQASVNMRKIPKQERSKGTIEAILDATAQLLAKQSASSLTTNHIAKRAGISIGSFYQYFPNKMAVFMAYAERERLAREKEAADQLANMEAATVDEATRKIIRALIASVGKANADRQLALLVMMHRLEDADAERPIDRIASVVSGKIGAYFDIEKPKSAVASFVLTRAITSTIRTTAFDNPEMLKEQEFEDQLVRLANGFLQAQ